MKFRKKDSEELRNAMLSVCNTAPDLILIDPVLFAEEWQEGRGLGGCLAGLAERVLAWRTSEKKDSDKAYSGQKIEAPDVASTAEEMVRLALREEVLLKLETEDTKNVLPEASMSFKKGTFIQLDMLLRCQKMAVPLTEWFQEHARILRWRSDPRPYYVWISEIMLQQTRVEAVKGYFDRFVEALPDVRALAECPEERLLKLWEGLGYYNRVRNLQRAAIQVMEEYEGNLPDSYEKLQKLPGIGSYTAGAIASIAYGKPAPAVDGNVLRVLKRLTGSLDDITRPAVKKEAECLFGALSKWVQERGIKPGDLNQALMELGATVCLPTGKPLCDRCPVEALCRIAGEESWREIPVKPVKKRRKIEERTVFVILQEEKQRRSEGQTEIQCPDSGERIGLCKRPAKGLLAGLWELPNIEGKLNREEAESFLQDALETEVLEIVDLGEAKHIFSHVEWRMVGYAAKIRKYKQAVHTLPPIQMVTEEELEQEYSLPSAFEAYRPGKGVSITSV